MNTESRTNNSMKNVLVGSGGQVLSIFLNFISRSIFIYFLGIEYLGINGLFTNILSILSLAELGIGNAIIYSMYKPIADNDKEKLKGLMNLYSTVYKIIGIVIAVIGICITPFLGFIIKNKPDIDNLTLIYLMFLTNTVVSYFFSYKRSIITCDQRLYICLIYKYIFIIIKIIAQSIILVFTRDFILFLAIEILCTLGENIAISIKADRLYPFLKNRKNSKLDLNMKKDIFKNTKALVIYKVCGVMVSGTDNIIISSFIGVTWVGLLSNYTLIISAISSIIVQITGAVTASIGNIVSSEEKGKQEDVFNVVLFASFILYGFSAICLLILINPFISLWIGTEYNLSKVTVIILAINFYIEGMQNVVWTYRSTMGLFVHGKYRPVVSAIVNLVSSIILVKYLGILGVLLGTTITRVVTNVWYDPIIVFKYGFNKSVISYYKKYLKYFLIGIITFIITYYSTLVITDVSVLGFTIKMIITTLVPVIIFMIIFYKSYEFNYLKNKVNSVLNKGRVKIV